MERPGQIYKKFQTTSYDRLIQTHKGEAGPGVLQNWLFSERINLVIPKSTGTPNSYINSVAIDVAQNGTTSIGANPTNTYGGGTVVSGTPFTPTPGNLLVVVVAAPTTFGSAVALPTPPPTGWSNPSSGNEAYNGADSYLYVWTRTATGSDSISGIMNEADRPAMFHFMEFTAGSTFVASAAGNPTSGVSGVTLSGLTGTNDVFYALSQVSTNANPRSVTWATGTELVDYIHNGSAGNSNGYFYSIARNQNFAGSSTSSIPTISSGASYQGLAFAINVAAPQVTPNESTAFSLSETSSVNSTNYSFLNHVTILGPRNGTTTHTINPLTGTPTGGTNFNPTAGRLLVAVVSGGVTSTTPTGWSLLTSAISNTGLYVWYRTATGTSNDQFTTTHNGSNYPVWFDIYEFQAGSTIGNPFTANTQSPGQGMPTVSGLSGTNDVFFVANMFLAAADTSTTTTNTSWANGAVRVTDVIAPYASTTDGNQLSVAHLVNVTASSASSQATPNPGPRAGERIGFAVQVSTVIPPTAVSGSESTALSVSETSSIAKFGQVSYVGKGTVGENTTAATTLNIPYPAGLQAGDLMIGFVSNTTTTVPSTPSGWNNIAGGNTGGGSSPSYRIFYKYATGAESGSAPIATPNNISVGHIIAYRGVNPSTPIDVSAIGGSSTATNSYPVNITPSTGGTAMVYIGVGNASTPTWNTPAGFTSVDNEQSSLSHTMGHNLYTDASARIVNVSHDGSVRGWSAVISLAPALYPASAAVDTTDAGSVSVVETASLYITQPTTDTVAVSVAETRTSALSMATTDVGSVSTNETTSANNTFSSSDTVSVSLADISNVGSTTPANDSIAVSVSETSVIAKTSSTSESNSLAVSETSAIYSAPSTTDTGVISVSETQTSNIIVSTTDTGSISSAETTSGTVQASAAESNSLSVAEVSTSYSTISRTDTSAVSVAETTSGVITASASEAVTVSVSDASGIATFAPGLDTASISVAETSAVYVTTTTTDTGSLAIADSSAQMATFSTADTGSIAASETTSSFRTLSASESASIAVSESSSLLLNVAIASSESNSLSVTESTTAYKQISTDDTSALVVDEVANIDSTSPAYESIAVGTSEQAFVDGSSTASESVSVALSETSTSDLSSTSTDTTAVSVSEAMTIANSFTTTDAGAVSIAESRTLLKTSNRTDTAAVSVADVSAVFKMVPTSDAGSIAVAETSSVSIYSPATETTGVGIVEQTSTFAVTNSTDALDMQVGESGIVDIDGRPDDGAGVSIFEDTGIYVTLASSDIGSLAVDENANVQTSSPANDNASVGLTEQTDTTVQVTASEDNGLYITETAHNYVKTPAVDSMSVSVSENINIFKTVVSSETIAVSVSDNGSTGGSNVISSTESTTIGVSENASVFIDTPGADTSGLMVAETSGVVVGGGLDVSASDSIAVAISEANTINVQISTGEVDTLSADESTSGSNAVTASEANSVSVTESRTINSALTRTDGNALAVSETKSISGAALAYGESLDLVVTEQAIINEIRQFNESITIAITETTSITTSGGVTKSGTDNGYLMATDESYLAIRLNRNDTAGIALAEAVSFGTIVFSSTDSGALVVSEIIVKPAYATDETVIALEEIAQVISAEHLSSHDAADGLVIHVGEHGKVWIIGGENTPIEFASKVETAIISSTGSRKGTVVESGSDGNKRIVSTQKENIRVE